MTAAAASSGNAPRLRDRSDRGDAGNRDAREVQALAAPARLLDSDLRRIDLLDDRLDFGRAAHAAE